MTHFRYLTLFVFLVLTLPLSAQVPVLECDHPDYDALESFFYATGGEDWARADGWITTCDPCSWYGVRCDPEGRVSALALPSNNLVGEIPASIAGMDNLSTLSAPGNRLSGSIPAELFELDLWDVFLSKNELTGSIPTNVGDATNLQYLRLDANDLTGEVPAGLTTLLNLERLYLNDNRLSGALPAGFADLPELDLLLVQNNDLGGCLPEDLRARCGDNGFRFHGNPGLPWSGDFASFCASSLTDGQIGAPCDDGDPNTFDDTINENCDCGPMPDGLTTPDAGELAEDPSGNLADDGAPGNSDGNPNGLTSPGSPGGVLLLARELTVYPNPVSGDELTVSLPGNEGDASLRLLSLTGSVVAERGFTGPSINLPLPQLEPGLYLVETVAEGIRTTRRVVVE